jgi:hypothetical protein
VGFGSDGGVLYFYSGATQSTCIDPDSGLSLGPTPSGTHLFEITWFYTNPGAGVGQTAEAMIDGPTVLAKLISLPGMPIVIVAASGVNPLLLNWISYDPSGVFTTGTTVTSTETTTAMVPTTVTSTSTQTSVVPTTLTSTSTQTSTVTGTTQTVTGTTADGTVSTTVTNTSSVTTTDIATVDSTSTSYTATITTASTTYTSFSDWWSQNNWLIGIISVCVSAIICAALLVYAVTRPKGMVAPPGYYPAGYR